MTANPYIHALLRYWWIVAVGAVVAVVAAVEMVASIGIGLPPKVTLRTPPRYTATEMLLVNSSSNPYLRTSVTAVVRRGSKTTVVKQKAASKTAVPPAPQVETVPQPPSVAIQQPNVQALVRAANFYPRLIPSDLVIAVRNQMFGRLHGSVTATALNSFQTPSRYRPSSFPIIQLNATAHRPKAAVALASATTAAFERWLRESQQEAGVPPAERILIQQLQEPTGAVSTGGPKTGLPIFVGLAVLAAFGGIAIVLDRLRGGRTGAEKAPAGPETRPVGPHREPFPDGVRVTHS